MSLLQMVTVGREAQPPRIMVYGSEGVGKSTFAANAPRTVFIQTEDGLSEIDCSKLKEKTVLAIQNKLWGSDSEPSSEATLPSPDELIKLITETEAAS